MAIPKVNSMDKTNYAIYLTVIGTQSLQTQRVAKQES